MVSSRPVLVAAIDFGTTYSSWAFSFQHEYDSDPTKISAKQWKGHESQKGPTCALIKPDGKTLHAFGFDAETKYSDLLEEDNDEGYYFFKRFKMRLCGQARQIKIHRDTEIEDIQGKSLLAKTVFALSIKYLKDDLLAVTNDRVSSMIKESEIHWVLTVPAIWDDGAKQFMREAAIEAGILADKLTIALEPEAASLFCRHLSVEKSGNQTSLAKFTTGKRYLVLDAGGGTIDVTAHEVVGKGRVKELYKASGGAWGGTKVDDAFLDFLTLVTGPDVIDSFKKSNLYDYNDMMKRFEMKKRSITHESESKVVMSLPLSLLTTVKQKTGKEVAETAALSKFGKEVSVVGDKLKMTASIARTFFKTSVTTTADHVADLLKKDANKGIQAILMVGGFSESPLLQHTIQSRFSSLKVIIPDEAGLSILKGAVIFGHSPNAITERIILLTSAIDFGTTYSSWAFSFQHEYDSDPTKVSAKQWKGEESTKGPTCALIKPDGKTLHAFGFDAETKYSDLLEEDNDEGYFFFKRFKMRLLGQTIHRDTEIEDIQGKSLLAKTVFALSIKYLKDDLLAVTNDRVLGMIKDSEIHWVLTVPAIWDDGAKQFMREAAIEAGILADKLTIALEPEAASLFCRHLSVEKSGNQTSLAKFTAGKRYLVLDAGGGTIDVTAHEVVGQGRVKELYKASGGAWGGTKVDDAFLDFLTLITGTDVIDSFKKSNLYDYNDMMKRFEVKKRSITHESESKVVIRLPLSLLTTAKQKTGKDVVETAALSKFGNEVSVVGDKLKMTASIARTFFQKSVSTTADHVADLLKKDANKGIQAIVMVGGFSESPLLQHTIQSRFSSLKVIIPDEAGLSILKGAVIFGHSPNAITERISKYTYGVKTRCLFDESKHPMSNKVIRKDGVVQCKSVFNKHVEAGQSLRIGDTQDEQKYRPTSSDQTSIDFYIFATKKTNPVLVTESGCFQIGKLCVPISGTGCDRDVYVQMKFGGTEIEVTGKDKATGNAVEVKVDFL
ncbi:heat shock 70 kDa protein 12B-like [Mya arenaria]|uniref:heat shock 70 kDa protein 12B-like n=1 Tax=Mya arenaria TaxID=6604 RepID=UPI0022E4F73A|nr:heat shock 70 kDa protein 12B-like [Mya arenaria]